MPDRDSLGRSPWQRAIGYLVAMSAAFVAWTAAASATTIGETVIGRVVVGQKQVPLPAGTWEVAAVGAQDLEQPELGAYGVIENVILFRRLGRGVVAVTEINANSVPVDDGWGLAPSCMRATQFLLLTRYRTGWDLSCMLVQPTYAPTGGPGPRAWREALRQAAADGIAVPDLWLTAGFRISDRQDVVDVRYHFAPGILIDRLAGPGRRSLELVAEHRQRRPAAAGGGAVARVVGGGRGRVDRARPAQPAGRGRAGHAAPGGVLQQHTADRRKAA